MKQAVFSILLFLSLVMGGIVNAQPDGLYNRALNLYVRGDYSGAEKVLREYLQKRPEPSAYYLLGYALYKQKRFAEAMESFKEAYLLDPDFTPRKIDFSRAGK